MKKRKPRTSKYVGKTYDNGWKCTYCGIATVAPIRAKYAHRSYYYLLERQTSDGVCVKQIRVNANYMAYIARGQMLAEDFANRLKQKKSKKATKKVNYAFN